MSEGWAARLGHIDACMFGAVQRFVRCFVKACCWSRAWVRHHAIVGFTT